MGRSPVGSRTMLPLEEGQSRIPSVEERYTPELVIALVGPIGSGVSMAAGILADTLRNQFGYTGNVLKVSDLLNAHAGAVAETPAVRGSANWTDTLQRIGSKLRETKTHAYTADLAIGQINLDRDADRAAGRFSERRFTIIDSLKHPAEVARLQHVYGQAFWLLGVFAPEEKRRERISAALGSSHEVTRVMSVDEDEKNKWGQRVRDTVFLSDYFIRNDGDNDEFLKTSLLRLLDVIFGVGVQTPTRDESAMYAAASAAAKGACLSRQVGAVILNKQGEIIGTGNNDVPKSGGGLYTFEDGKGDHRCYKWKTKRCHNDDRKDKLREQIINALLSNGLLRPEKRAEAEEIIFSTDVKQLIEYSRAVHAEMEAIISVARSGGQGVKGATLYTTTYPCHNCARHIVAAGIDRVVYIEPYAKSLAIELHSDAITVDPGDKKRVAFVQYEGMAPKNLLKVFRHGQARKGADGRLVSRSRSAAVPILREHVDDFARREKIIAGTLAGVQNSAGPVGGGAANE